MAKKYNIHRISNRKAYSSEELAEVLSVHVQTIRTWKRQGMKSIGENSYPYLYLGSVAKAFLKEKIEKDKTKLSEDEFYCLRCRKAVIPKEYEIVDRKIIMGKGKKSIIKHAMCPECNANIRKFGVEESDSNTMAIKESKPITKITKTNSGDQITMFG